MGQQLKEIVYLLPENEQHLKVLVCRGRIRFIQFFPDEFFFASTFQVPEQRRSENAKQLGVSQVISSSYNLIFWSESCERRILIILAWITDMNLPRSSIPLRYITDRAPLFFLGQKEQEIIFFLMLFADAERSAIHNNLRYHLISVDTLRLCRRDIGRNTEIKTEPSFTRFRLYRQFK